MAKLTKKQAEALAQERLDAELRQEAAAAFGRVFEFVWSRFQDDFSALDTLAKDIATARAMAKNFYIRHGISFTVPEEFLGAKFMAKGSMGLDMSIYSNTIYINTELAGFLADKTKTARVEIDCELLSEFAIAIGNKIRGARDGLACFDFHLPKTYQEAAIGNAKYSALSAMELAARDYLGNLPFEGVAKTLREAVFEYLNGTSFNTSWEGWASLERAIEQLEIDSAMPAATAKARSSSL